MYLSARGKLSREKRATLSLHLNAGAAFHLRLLLQVWCLYDRGPQSRRVVFARVLDRAGKKSCSRRRLIGPDGSLSIDYLANPRPTTASGRALLLFQDLMCRRAAVASCCCAPWCCCFGPCHRHEDGNDDGGDVDADRTRVTDDAAQGSSGLNSFADVNLADEMEKGANMTVASFPPLVGETPPRAPRKSIAALYATPFHSVRQGRSSLAPARPARPGRKACAARHPSRRSAAAGSGCRGKRTAKLTARDPAAGVRRQRALVGRVRAKRRRVRGRFLP